MYGHVCLCLAELYGNRFWAECKDYLESFEGSRIVMGDFNDIASEVEQRGNEDTNHTNTNQFVDARNSCGLFDLQNSGSCFSWVRQIEGRVILCKRLDRIMWNMDVQLAYQEAKALTLGKTHLNHHPIKFIRNVGESAAR